MKYEWDEAKNRVNRVKHGPTLKMLNRCSMGLVSHSRMTVSTMERNGSSRSVY